MEDNKFIEITAETIGASAPVLLGSVIDGGIATIPSAILTSIVTKGAQHVMNTIHDDVCARQLSVLQGSRMEQVLGYAQSMYYRIVNQQGWQIVHPESEDYIHGTMEACEQTVMNAINESRAKKIPFEGYLLATQMVSGNDRFEDFHMMANILSKMTWSEMVLTALVYEDWGGHDRQLSITNPSASVEIYDLIVWGLVKPSQGWVVENNSAPVLLSDLSITEFGKQFYDAVVLKELTLHDKDSVLQTLQLKILDTGEQSNRIHTASEESIRDIVNKIKPEIVEEARPKWE